jgi:hypothetical protein
VAGGLALGTDVCSGGVFAGRVAVALGGGFVWAATSWTLERSTLEINAASVVTFVFILPSFQKTRTLELVLGFKLLANRQCPDAFSGCSADRVVKAHELKLSLKMRRQNTEEPSHSGADPGAAG